MADTVEQTRVIQNGTGGSRGWLTPAVMVRIIILAVVLGFYYRHVLYRLVYIWSNVGDWSHGFIIPFFGLYYLYLRRDRMPLGVVESSYIPRIFGAVLLVLSFGLYMLCFQQQMEYPKTISLIVSIFGVILLTCGWPMSRWSWFAVGFLIFAMPLPTRLYVQMTMPLRFIAAEVSAAVLQLSVSDMMAEARGAVVEYIYQGRPGTLDIEQACSGIRLMMTMTALGVAMAFVSERPMWQRMIMILACVPIAIFCNIIRVTTTGFLVVLDYQEFAHGFWHTLLGLMMLFIAFLLYGAISYVLSHLFVDPSENDEPAVGAAGGSSA